MKQNHSIKLFENKKVRTQWVQTEEKWYFSIIDVVFMVSKRKLFALANR